VAIHALQTNGYGLSTHELKTYGRKIDSAYCPHRYDTLYLSYFAAVVQNTPISISAAQGFLREQYSELLALFKRGPPGNGRVEIRKIRGNKRRGRLAAQLE